MKKTSIILSLGLLIGIVGVFFISPVTALTPEGIWGTSAGDQLYYTYTTNATGSDVVTYARVDITAINTTAILGVNYNCLWAKTFTYGTTGWFQSYPEVVFAGYNATYFAWYGGYLATFPTPAPIPFSWVNLNTTIMAAYTLWGLLGGLTTGLEGNTASYVNSTDEIYLTYDPDTGICLENNHVYVTYGFRITQEYIGETDPFAPEEPKIPGFNPILIVSMLGVTGLLIGLKIKKK